MKVNEKEIFDVSDASSLIIKQKKINSKKSLQALLNDVSLCSDYHSVSTHERFARFNLSSHVNLSESIEFYDLFVIRAHRRLLTDHTNLRADMKLKKMSKEKKRRF